VVVSAAGLEHPHNHQVGGFNEMVATAKWTSKSTIGRSASMAKRMSVEGAGLLRVQGVRTGEDQAAPAVVPGIGVVTSCHPAPCLTDHAVAT
jgi:hypothetical protein